MEHNLFLQIVLIVFLGVTSHWIANIFKLPAIVFFLSAGFLAGPIFHIIEPQILFGNLLFPFVTFSVAIILFEGGMDLNLNELKKEGRAIGQLIFIGSMVTWMLASFSAYFILKLNFSISLLIGSILIVTGPTVVTPMLKHIRPKRNLGHILKWEGIVNDPIGVIIAVLILQSILIGQFSFAGWIILVGIIKTIFISVSIASILTFFLIYCFKKYWVSDDLHHAVVFMFVLLAKYLSDYFLHESGLLTVTLMGIGLANQKFVPTKHILEFKENLRTLILSCLFVVLSAHLDLATFKNLSVEYFYFILVLIFIIRPASVFISTIKTDLAWKEKIFISFLAPRGIVAVATAVVFSHELLKSDYLHASAIEPLIFLVVMVTVIVYGFGAPLLANILKINDINAQGVLIIGAHSWVRKIAVKLKSLGFNVLLVDSNAKNVRLAKKIGLKAVHKNVLSDAIHEELDFQGIGKILSMTPNDEANSLACLRFREIFERVDTYQICPEHEESGEKPQFFEGRFLFEEKLTFDKLDSQFKQKNELNEILIENDFSYMAFRQRYVDVLPLFVAKKNNALDVISIDKHMDFQKGDKVIALAKS